ELLGLIDDDDEGVAGRGGEIDARQGGERGGAGAQGDGAPAGGEERDDAGVDERALAGAGGTDDGEQRLDEEAVDEGLGGALAAEEPGGVAGGEGGEAPVGRLLDRGGG